MRALESIHGAVIASLSVLALTSAAVVARGFENGAFDDGMAGWQVESARKEIGLAQAATHFGIEPFRGEATLARLDVGASAGTLDPISGPGGAAVARARLQQDLSDIPSTTLTFDWIAGYSGVRSGRGVLGYGARVIVERATPVLRQEYDPFESGGQHSPGAPIVLDARPMGHQFYADLDQAGFEVGDDIRVIVEMGAQARALRSSDFVAFGGTLWVDRFALHSLVQRQGRELSASMP